MVTDVQPNDRCLHVSIQLVSPARGEARVWRTKDSWRHSVSFHSIGFPCERGGGFRAFTLTWSVFVSIQLVSPARGEVVDECWDQLIRGVSIQLVSPARGEGGTRNPPAVAVENFSFPFNWFPLREGRPIVRSMVAANQMWFPFNWFPLREGR